jgi:pimeloyl-ACP methyl ester carboxylesterase
VAVGRRRAAPRAELVKFRTDDEVDLAGLLFEPRRATDRAVIFLHGTGGSSIFESSRTNPLAAELTANGFAYFPFNNRGAHLVRRLRERSGGAAFEIIRECVFDIDAAIATLRRRGYRDFTLVGHSTGANKIAVYDHYRPRNRVRRYVLLGGGDDTGTTYAHLGARRFAAALAKARERVRAGRGDDFVPPALSHTLMTWRAFLDMNDPDGDYNVFPFLEVLRGVRLSKRPRFRYVKAIRKPSLLLYGDQDEFAIDSVSQCVAVLADAIGAKPNIELAIMEDADHSFSGRESELGALIAEWIETTAP